jgi:hypothetical protein
MPRPKRPTHEMRESELLNEVRAFMRVVACMLRAVIKPTRMLHARMVRTHAYQRVDGLDGADREPMWDLAGTLHVMLQEDLEHMANYLDRGGRRRHGHRTPRPARRHS